MARLARLVVPGMAHHVIARGNNRQAIVQTDEDRQAWLDLLLAQSNKHAVALHAYVLMDNHFHLIVAPETEAALPAMMQALGRCYVRAYNQRHGRTGTLFEGRYRTAVMDTDHYLLNCMVYVDLNPVRAGMVTEAADYAWSSHRHYVGLQPMPGLSVPKPVWQLGNTPFAREATYRERVSAGLKSTQVQDTSRNTLSGWALGDEAFKARLSGMVDRRVSPGRPGRPAKK